MQDLSGTRAVVTGGTRGLGLGIVESLAARGAEVTAVGRDAARASAARDAGATIRVGDAADQDLVNRTIAEVQVLAPMQMIGKTELVETVAGCYAKRVGVDIDAFLSERYQKPPLSTKEYSEYVATILTEPAYASGVAFGIDSVNGITFLQG